MPKIAVFDRQLNPNLFLVGGAGTGAPQPGQATTSLLIWWPHSGHGFNAI